MEQTPAQQDPWYADGLRFACTECGNCCTGGPGYVFVSDEEIEKIAAHLGRAEQGLGKKYLRRVGRAYSLTEDKKTGDCCFLDKLENGRRGCSIYPVRPLQCRTWPFWNCNLEVPEAWEISAKDCPGMNTGSRYDYVQIEVRRKARCWEDLPA